MSGAPDPGFAWWAHPQAKRPMVDDAGKPLTDDSGKTIYDGPDHPLLAAVMMLATEMRARMATFSEQIDLLTKNLDTHNTELADRLKEIDARLEAMTPGSSITQEQVDALVAQVQAAQKNADAASALLAIRAGAFASGLPISSATVGTIGTVGTALPADQLHVGGQ